MSIFNWFSRKKIFLSYASEQEDIAKTLKARLEAAGHDVFRDAENLERGKPYDDAIRKGIEDCDVFIFLISPQAVTPGRYSLTELKIASKKWRKLKSALASTGP